MRTILVRLLLQVLDIQQIIYPAAAGYKIPKNATSKIMQNYRLTTTPNLAIIHNTETQKRFK